MLSVHDAHPSRELLQRFGLGQVDDSAAEGVNQHLESCSGCRSLVAGLPGDDFLQRLRQVHNPTSTPFPGTTLAPLSPALQPLPTTQAALVHPLPAELKDNAQYEVVRELGAGGMGVVYLARNKRMDRLEVLKVINAALIHQEGALERFLREIRAAAALNHENVVKAYSAPQFGQLLVFAMEYVDGDNLAKRVERHGPLPIANACHYAQQAALGLQHAHKEKGMVHRDIKPHNLMLTPSGQVKILDFGLARFVAEGEGAALTEPGQGMGTPAYIAPEQAENAHAADIRADIYSLGCTLYFLLSGAHRSLNARPLNRVRPEVPVKLAALVDKMLAKEPGKRYQTPAEVAQALTPFVKPQPAPPPPPNAIPLKLTTLLVLALLAAGIWGYYSVPWRGANPGVAAPGGDPGLGKSQEGEASAEPPAKAGQKPPPDSPPPPREAESEIGAADAKSRADLARKAENLLKQYCFRCHGKGGRAEDGFGFSGDRDRLVEGGMVVPGKPAVSKLFKKVAAGKMPKKTDNGEKLPPFPANGKDILEKWIAAGAPDWGAAKPPRGFISNRDINTFILDDLEKKIAERDRKHMRYFTITHLYNAGLVDEELLSYRVGLSKLVNSLSWNNTITKPVPIDPKQTIFRIDLRDYDWDAEVEWKAILAANPYAVIAKGAAYTGSTLPLVRADWFVFAASRPPLYHDLLRLPETDGELEKKLEVDVLKNIKNERVWRAGFNRSGVSQNNRLIERHKSPYGAYWKSYDFATNVDRKDLFTHPRGPGAHEQFFQQDGGEIIFNLPNGLQAYVLVNARGKRIDKGPLAIVSDREQPDKTVLNGISCMRCHADGINPREDQVRARAEANRTAFEKEEYDLILALYPPADKLADKFAEDTKRFREAVAKTGAHLSETEPVFALARQFEEEINLKLAAAEVGVREKELREALDDFPDLARAVGELKVGTMKRDKFVTNFGLIVSKFPEVGEFVPGLPREHKERKDHSDRELSPKVGDRVTFIAEATGGEDEDPEQTTNTRRVLEGEKGKVIRLDKKRDDLCQIRLDKPDGIEVWVPIKKVKVTKE